MNVLITSASRKVSLVKAFKEAAHKVIAVDSSPHSAALYFADKYSIVPSGVDGPFMDAIQDICLEEGINIIVPTRDEEIPAFSLYRPSFESLNIHLMIPSFATIKICQDKHLFNIFCQTSNFDIPEIRTQEDITKEPLFVRGRYSKGSRSAFLCSTELELNHVLFNLTHPIIQEYVAAQEYTVDMFLTREGEVISVVPRQRTRTFGGESFVGKTVRHYPIIAAAIDLGTKLGLRGHNTIQCFDHEGVIKFIEVNPRYGGGSALGFAAGAHTPEYLVKELSGKPVEPMIGRFIDGLIMLRYTDDYFILEDE